ncbi:MAG: hypothetical protein MR568_23260 [Eisenbergiella massiliensis]|uniref:hypothetical protein n=1 Tax=Eisenbergiella massiliensis TaxID=1720294 RepID=UPI0023F31C02|nr:hypothetical protein [Eisenbergiella massiliensis]MCI6709805.1 hypothetical protein [Eisenbergiella massiliensis]
MADKKKTELQLSKKQGNSSGRFAHSLRKPCENVVAAGIRPSPKATYHGRMQ